MGIQGLLPSVKPVSRKCNLTEMKGFRVAIDGYSWLHKSCFGCAYELSVGIPTAVYLRSFMNKIQILVSAGVIPVVVFDGADIPLKDNTNDGRQGRREVAQAKAKKLLADGERLKAVEQYQRALDITAEIALSVIKVLQKNKIEVQVSPYEADSQLAYLARTNYVHAVITEDSDLLPFGAPRVLYKVDYHTGVGDLILYQDALKVSNPPLSPDQFLRMCVLSGCDYLKSVKGVGIKKALSWCTLSDSDLALALSAHAKEVLSVEEIAKYIEGVKISEIAFRHQRVLEYGLRKMTYLTEPSEVVREHPEFDQIVGPAWDPDTVEGVLDMKIDPTTMQPYSGVHDVNIDTVADSVLKIRKPTDQTRQLSLLSFVQKKPSTPKTPKTPKTPTTTTTPCANSRPPLPPSTGPKSAVSEEEDGIARRVVRSRFFVKFKSKRSLYEETLDDKTTLARVGLFSSAFPDDETSISLTSLSDEDSISDESTPPVKRAKADQSVESPPSPDISEESTPREEPIVVKKNPFLAFVNKSGT